MVSKETTEEQHGEEDGRYTPQPPSKGSECLKKHMVKTKFALSIVKVTRKGVQKMPKNWRGACQARFITEELTLKMIGQNVQHSCANCLFKGFNTAKPHRNTLQQDLPVAYLSSLGVAQSAAMACGLVRGKILKLLPQSIDISEIGPGHGDHSIGTAPHNAS